jgi:hypothetical protein
MADSVGEVIVQLGVEMQDAISQLGESAAAFFGWGKSAEDAAQASYAFGNTARFSY